MLIDADAAYFRLSRYATRHYFSLLFHVAYVIMIAELRLRH